MTGAVVVLSMVPVPAQLPAASSVAVSLAGVPLRDRHADVDKERDESAPSQVRSSRRSPRSRVRPRTGGRVRLAKSLPQPIVRVDAAAAYAAGAAAEHPGTARSMSTPAERAPAPKSGGLQRQPRASGAPSPATDVRLLYFASAASATVGGAIFGSLRPSASTAATMPRPESAAAIQIAGVKPATNASGVP